MSRRTNSWSLATQTAQFSSNAFGCKWNAQSAIYWLKTLIKSSRVRIRLSKTKKTSSICKKQNQSPPTIRWTPSSYYKANLSRRKRLARSQWILSQIMTSSSWIRKCSQLAKALTTSNQMCLKLPRSRKRRSMKKRAKKLLKQKATKRCPLSTHRQVARTRRCNASYAASRLSNCATSWTTCVLTSTNDLTPASTVFSYSLSEVTAIDIKDYKFAGPGQVKRWSILRP